MRKIPVFVILALFLTFVFSPAAFAYKSGEAVIYGNEESGCVSFGDHGYCWYHSGTYKPDDTDKKVRHLNWLIGSKDGKVYYDVYNGNKKHYLKLKDRIAVLGTYAKKCDLKGEWLYYIDNDGVKHYFYYDPDREYEWHSYKDKNGNTQYYYVIKG